MKEEEIKQLDEDTLDTKPEWRFGDVDDEEVPVITERNIQALVDKVNELTREVNSLKQRMK